MPKVLSDKKYGNTRIGEVYTTNEWYELVVIDGSYKKNYCTVKIGEYTEVVQSQRLKLGNIETPYHPRVCGYGYNAEGEYSSKTHPKLYTTWKGMLERSYSEGVHKRQPNYRNVTVHKDWHNLQTFGKWFEENYVEGYQLDKDLLSVGDNKIYSADTCVFIPMHLNLFLAHKKPKASPLPLGVSPGKNKKRFKASIRSRGKAKQIGTFDTVEEASQAYQKARAEEAELLKEEYKDILPQKALDAIK